MARAQLEDVVTIVSGKPAVGSPAVGVPVQVAVHPGAVGSSTLYAAETGSATVEELHTNANGKFSVWLEEGRYDVTVGNETNTYEVINQNSVSGATPSAQLEAFSEELAGLAEKVAELEQSVIVSGAPVVTTEAIAANGTPTEVKLKGKVTTNGSLATKWFFEYGPTSALGKSTKVEEISAVEAAEHPQEARAKEVTLKSTEAGEEFTSVWFYRLAAQNTVKAVKGQALQLEELKKPTVQITSATSISAAEATFNGYVSANKSATTVKIKYGTTSSVLDGEVTANSVSATEEGLVPVKATLKAVLSGTNYFKIVAKNAKSETVESAAESYSVPGTSGVLLVGDEAVYAEVSKTSAGRVEFVPYTVLATGTLEAIKLETKEAEAAITSVRMAVAAEDGTGKPVVNAVLAEGVTTTGVTEANKVLEVTGLSLKVTAGEKLFLVVLPIGGQIKMRAKFASFGTGNATFESKSGETAHTACSTVAGFETNGAQAPMTLWATGKTGGSEPGSTVVLSVNADKQTVEWQSVSTETEYNVEISNAPQSNTGRTTAIINQLKTANPQKFKPEAKKTYGATGATQFTPKEGETVFIGAKPVNSASWSAEVSSLIPGAPPPPAVTGQIIGVYAGSGQTTGIFKRMNEAGIRYYRPGTSSARTEEYIRVAAENKVTCAGPIFTGKTAEKLANIGAFNEEIINFFKKYGVGGSFWSGKAFTERPVREFEIFNEPGLSGETTNYKGYGELVEKVKHAIEAAFPTAATRPLLIANCENGGGSLKFGEEAERLVPGSMSSFADGLVVHAYGGSGGQYSSLPNFPWAKTRIEAVHAKWSRNIYVTELGWPIEKGTGDSQGWTEAQQAENVKKFSVWMKEPAQSYVKSFLVFADFDESSERKYGMIEGNALNNRARTGWAELGKYSKELAGF